MKLNTQPIKFYAVEAKHKPTIINWFSQSHVIEFYYGDGLKNTLDNLELYCQGINNNGRYSFDHWIAYLDDDPFGFLMTSPVEPSDGDELDKWCIEGKKTSTLDLLIGNPKYLGKGLSVAMIRAFIRDKFSDYDFFIIDPEVSNTRAIHVYQKAGFRVQGEFCPSFNPIPHLMMRLAVVDLVNERD